MILDEVDDPNNPLSEPFQNQMFERAKRLDALRTVASTNPQAAKEFRDLAAEQLQACEQLLRASERFPADESDSPASVFRRAMTREIDKLRADARSS